MLYQDPADVVEALLRALPAQIARELRQRAAREHEMRVQLKQAEHTISTYQFVFAERGIVPPCPCGGLSIMCPCYQRQFADGGWA